MATAKGIGAFEPEEGKGTSRVGRTDSADTFNHLQDLLEGPINEKNTTTSIPNHIPTTVYMYNGYQILSGLSLVSLHPLGTP